MAPGTIRITLDARIALAATGDDRSDTFRALRCGNEGGGAGARAKIADRQVGESRVLCRPICRSDQPISEQDQY